MSTRGQPGGSRTAASHRHVGFLTTDAGLVVRSWDAALAAMTGIPADSAKGRRLDEIVPDLAERGLLDMIREPLASGGTQVLAPALHHHLIPCPTARPSAEFTTMQQRVVVTPLRDDDRVVGLAVSVEDVTERLERERQLARELRAADPAARRAAVARLAEHPPLAGMGPLEAALGDEDWQVRRAAVGVVANQAEADLVHALVAALREGHRDFSLLSSALKLLSMTGVDATVALIELLKDEDSDLRIQAALALGTQRRSEAVHALLDALDDPDTNVRFHAIEALGKLGATRAVDRLAAIVESRDFFLAFPALDALVRIRDASAAPKIVALLDDPVLASAAAEALGQLGDETAVPPLVAALDAVEPPTGAIVDALTAIHAQYEETSGAAGHIEDLVRRSVTAEAANRILAEVPRAAGAHLRNVVSVLGWLRGESIERALAHLLGRTAVNHDAIEALVRFGSPMVGLLIEQLGREEADTRRAAVIALGRIGDRRAVEPLVGLIENGDRELFVAVAGALARLGDGRAYEPLLALIGDDDIAVRQAAVGALNSIGHPAMADRIATLLDSADRNVRESAVRIAGYFGYPSCAEKLLACAHDPDEGVRAAALEHLAYLEDPRVIAVLVDRLAADTPRARSAAAHALAHVDGDQATAALRAALRDPDSWVRYFAAASIGRRRDVAAFDELAAIAGSDRARQVRVAAIEAIGAIGGERAIDILAPMTTSADSDVAATALRALGGIESPAVVPVLQDSLRSPDPRRRTAAVDAFAAWGGRDAIDALQWTASADADPIVSRAAMAALGTLAGRRAALAEAAIDALLGVALDPARRHDALAVLARVPPAAIPALGTALARDDASARAIAVEALGRLARPAASSYLMRALDDADAAVRQRAVTALSRLGTRGIGKRLAAIARTDHSAAVRRAAEVALSRVDVQDGGEGRA